MAKRSGHLVMISPPAAVTETTPAGGLDDVNAALQAMADAAVVSGQRVKDVAAASFAVVLGGHEAIVVERVGDGWNRASSGSSNLDPRLAEIPATIPVPGEIVNLAGIGLFMPVKAGVGILADLSVTDGVRVAILRSLATGFDLALMAATQNRVTQDAMDEVVSLQQVAKRILSTSELDEVLFSITRETTRLLNADIGGVFLRDGNDLVMRSCVGNVTLDIDRLRMQRAQGLAGRVFDTARPCKVDDYLGSDLLSQDFFSLARDERIRCAVGAPLHTREGVIGVLEVWRRRKVPFSDQDVRRIVALANLTTIAIQNAQMYESQRVAVQQLTLANESLRHQNEFIRRSSELQDDMTGALLDGGGVASIARIVARYAAVEVAILDTDFSVMATYPMDVPANHWLTQIEAANLQVPAHANATTAITPLDHSWLSMRPIVAGGDRIGWVCAVSRDKPGDIHEVAVRQAAIASALCFLEQRAASLARSAALGALMWDLLEGTAPVRQAALNRLKDFAIELKGPVRVIHGRIEKLPETARMEGWTTDMVERKQRAVCEACERALPPGALKLIALRGDSVVAIVSVLDAGRVTKVLTSLHKALLAGHGVTTTWGVSAPCDAPSHLPSANSEAISAAQAVVRLRATKCPVVLHEQLGMLTLLLQGNGNTDGRELHAFISRTLGPVLNYDSVRRGVLAKTVRTFLDNDCSLKITARQLFVHEKTVRYRLSRFEELAGVDLRRHRDRMSVDLALLMHAFATLPADATG